MKRLFIHAVVALLLFCQSGLLGASDLDNTLTVTVARKMLGEAMTAIAQDIGGLKGAFPQLADWEEAFVTPEKIEYRYRYSEEEGFEKNGCLLSITSRNQPVLVSASGSLPELKMGIYLKMTAEGIHAESLKQAVQGIVGRHFQTIRSLPFLQSVQ